MSLALTSRTSGRHQVAVGVSWVLSAFALIAAGYVAPTRPEIAVALASLLLALGVSLAEPAAIPVLIIPVTLSAQRVAAGGVDLTVSDLALAIACIPAFIYVLGDANRSIRNLLYGVGIYQFATLLTVANNPYLANVVEWVHAGVLIAGALVVGWAIGRRGFARPALHLLLISLIALAGAGLVQIAPRYLAGDFGPLFLEWPISMHKNHLGAVLALGAIVLWVRPAWLGLSKMVTWPALIVIVAALGATQSRQAIVGLVSAIGYVSLRRGRARGVFSILLIVTPVLASVAYAVQKQIESGNIFNSTFERVAWYEQAMSVWKTDPWFGVGLRWWYTPRFDIYSQPPSAVLDVLTSSGVVGITAFVIHWVVTWRVVRRVSPEFALLATAVLVVRFVQSQFDLYWASIQASLPFLIVGICVGAAALAGTGPQVDPEAGLGRL